MKCQILFSGENIKENNIINLSSAELAQTVVKAKKLTLFFGCVYKLFSGRC